jgi:bacillithiol system protein YtxJ
MIRRSIPKLEADWIQFDEQPDWNQLLEESKQYPVLIYKHSSRCGVSHASWDEVKELPTEFQERVRFYFVDVIKKRGISQAIAQQSGIRHESPQVLLLHQGSVLENWTHWAIRFPVIEERLSDLE